MKRNRKAEVAKQERQLTRQETEKKRLAVLMTELSTAAAQVLREEFNFSQEEVQTFLAEVYDRQGKIKADLPFDPNQKLGVYAQRFALAGTQVLAETHEFDKLQSNFWLLKLIEQGNQNRASS